MKLLLATLLLLPSLANAVELTRDFLVEQLVREALEKAKHTGASADRCEAPVITATHFTDLLKKRRETTIKDAHGNVQTLSILTRKEANELQAFANGDQNLAAQFSEDGCEQRAIETSRILGTQGIRSGVLTAFPGGFQDSGSFRADFPGAVTDIVWKHHVAPTIAVQDGGRITTMVIDPLLSKTPLTKVQWVAKLQARSESDDPVDVYLSTGLQSEDAVEKANAQLRVYREAQKKREALPAN